MGRHPANRSVIASDRAGRVRAASCSRLGRPCDERTRAGPESRFAEGSRRRPGRPIGDAAKPYPRSFAPGSQSLSLAAASAPHHPSSGELPGRDHASHLFPILHKIYEFKSVLSSALARGVVPAEAGPRGMSGQKASQPECSKPIKNRF